MTLDDLKAAEQARSNYERAIAHRTALKDHFVCEIIVGRGENNNRGEGTCLSPVRGGSGTISSIGYPSSLRAAMTSALMDWINSQINEAAAELKQLGVEVPL